MAVILSIADTRNPRSLASKLRRKRFDFFKSLVARVPRPLTILDVGGTEAFWQDLDLLDDVGIDVTLLNVDFPTQSSRRVRHVRGDARALAFPDKSFDVVYSNSVIEHVGERADQRRMAQEVMRVGRRHFVQTPSYYFPIEPHFLVPGFQFLPVAARVRLLQSFDLGWHRREKSRALAREAVESVKLLKRREFAAFFPESTLYDEHLLGLTKSFVAYGGFATRG